MQITTTTPTRLYPSDLDAMKNEPTRDDIICAVILAVFIGLLLGSGHIMRWLGA